MNTILLIFLLLNYQLFATEPTCSNQDEEIKPAHLEEIKKKFNQEIDDHYNRLFKDKKTSAPKREDFVKTYYKSYNDKDAIKVYSSLHNESYKVVYIEYDKNWWGSPYFVEIKNDKITIWADATYYGATSYCFWWEQDKFFYKTSTHMGSKATIRCILTW